MRAGRGVNWVGGSVIVDPDGYPAAGPLPDFGVAASVRAGRLRLAFHVNNTVEDADRAAEILRPHVLLR
ncbi:MAG TPA: hypothetical protein VGX23_09440 [Actinocrinis sp.]|nr:hypothetical protein [Actinocrinis sp.]